MGKKENFTVERIAGFKCQPGKSQSIYWDGKTPGLGLRVTASGTKSYIFESRLDGKTIRTTIGDTRTWSIGKAQAEATSLKTLTDKGIDPRDVHKARVEAKAAAEASEKASKNFTLAKLFEAYCEWIDKAGKKNTARVARSLFKTHAPASIRNKAAKDVTAEEFADVLRAITEQGKVRTAGALRTYTLAAYNVAARARLDPTLPVAFKAYGIVINPIAQIPAIGSNAGNRVLTDSELQKYIAALDNRETDLALKLALFGGGQRMDQVLRVTPRDWHAETKTLRLLDPKGRRKEPRIHLLPLGPIASEIVEYLVEKAEDGKPLFKINTATPGKRVKSICSAVGISHAFDLRDIRRTVETRMAGLGISKDTRAQLLSHGLGGVQDKHYDMHSYETEKRNALIAWEGWLEGVLTGSERNNVIKMDRKTVA